MDSIEWVASTPPSNLPKRLIGPWFFRQIISDSANVCFVKPNVSKNEVWVKVSKDDPVRIVKLDEFIGLFVQHVMFRLFPRDYEEYGSYSCWLYSENGIDLDGPDSSVYMYDDEFKFGMRDSLKEFLSTFPGKTQLKNMLVNFS